MTTSNFREPGEFGDGATMIVEGKHMNGDNHPVGSPSAESGRAKIDYAKLRERISGTKIAVVLTKREATALLDRIEDLEGEGEYVIWSNEHQLWWGPNCAGYRKELAHAGRYSRAEALDIAKGARDGWSADGNPDEIAVPLRDAEFCVPALSGEKKP